MGQIDKLTDSIANNPSIVQVQLSITIERFPEDFMFRLKEKEWENLKSQNATSSWGVEEENYYIAATDPANKMAGIQ